MSTPKEPLKSNRKDIFFHSFIALVHISSAYIVVKEFIPILSHDSTYAIFYIIVLTAFWSYYIYKKFDEERKSYFEFKDYQNKIIQSSQDKILSLTNEVSKGYELKRKSGYADALKHINSGFAHIHDIYRDNSTFEGDLQETVKTIEKFILEFGHLCSDIERAFSMITGFNCAVCIKIFAEEDITNKANCSVYTLKRDYISEQKRKHPHEKDVKHWISGNTSFNYIFNHLGDPQCRSFF